MKNLIALIRSEIRRRRGTVLPGWREMLRSPKAKRDERHFVHDYERHVASLLKIHPHDEAMSLAVGGRFEDAGRKLAETMIASGLEDGMALLDLGCGSGRLAHALAPETDLSRYLGIDIIPELLKHAGEVSPPHYEFICHRDLSIPADECTFDFVCAFSLFTHLLPAETYIYLEDARRVLKPGGRLVMSFLELENDAHWPVFEKLLNGTRIGKSPHLDMFVERSQIAVWARHLDMNLIGFLPDGDRPSPIGQSIAVLEKPLP